MKDKQSINPKYWIFHNKTSDDVFIATASKTYDMCVNKATKLYPDLVEEFWGLDNTNYSFSLFEIDFTY